MDTGGLGLVEGRKSWAGFYWFLVCTTGVGLIILTAMFAFLPPKPFQGFSISILAFGAVAIAIPLVLGACLVRFGPSWLRPLTAPGLSKSQRKQLQVALSRGQAVEDPELAPLVPVFAERIQKKRWASLLSTFPVFVIAVDWFIGNSHADTLLQVSWAMIAAVLIGGAAHQFFAAWRARKSVSATHRVFG